MQVLGADDVTAGTALLSHRGITWLFRSDIFGGGEGVGLTPQEVEPAHFDATVPVILSSL